MIRLRRITSKEDDVKENWWIVRKPDYLPDNAKWVPELSPTPELFAYYSSFYEKGTWSKEHFDSEYVPWFIKDLKVNEKGKEYLEYLKEISEKEDINLCCYCIDERICHKTIIAGILKGMGADIECSDEYLKYYRFYNEMK